MTPEEFAKKLEGFFNSETGMDVLVANMDENDPRAIQVVQENGPELVVMVEEA